MSWAVYSSNATIDARFDMCDHLQVGDKAPHVIGEDDTFGPVARLALCEACHKEHLIAEANEEDMCRDCGGTYKLSELNEWCWFDFHAPSGDEPRLVCKTCWDKPEHEERMRKDTDDYNRELEYLDRLDNASNF